MEYRRESRIRVGYDLSVDSQRRFDVAPEVTMSNSIFSQGTRFTNLDYILSVENFRYTTPLVLHFLVAFPKMSVMLR